MRFVKLVRYVLAAEAGVWHEIYEGTRVKITRSNGTTFTGVIEGIGREVTWIENPKEYCGVAKIEIDDIKDIAII